MSRESQRPLQVARLADGAGEGLAIHHVDVGPGDVGPGDEGLGTPVVLLPGLLGTHGWFRESIGPLAARRRVLAPDLPGFGRSDKPDAPYDVPWFTGVLARFLDHKGIERAHLVGNSLGGQIALALALARPERVERLVLVAPAGIVAWSPMLLQLLGVVAKAPLGVVAAPRLSPSALAVAFGAIFPGRDDLATRFARSYSRGFASPDYPLVVRAAVRALRGSLADPLLDAAHRVTAPTLIVWGERDRVLPVAGARMLRRRLPGVELSLYRDSGHCPMVDAPERFTREVGRFLDGEPVGI